MKIIFGGRRGEWSILFIAQGVLSPCLKLDEYFLEIIYSHGNKDSTVKNDKVSHQLYVCYPLITLAQKGWGEGIRENITLANGEKIE